MVIYVDPQNGSNGNVGTFALPLKHLWYAKYRANITGERVELTNTTLALPYHGSVEITENYVLGTDGSPQYISPAANISNNVIREDTTRRFIFDTATNWGGGTGGTVSNETDNTIFTGAKHLRLNGTSAQAYTRKSINFGPRNFKKWRLVIKYRADAAATFRMRIEQEMDANEWYWKTETGTWESTGFYFPVYDSDGTLADSTTWTEITTAWIDADATKNGAGGTAGTELLYLESQSGGSTVDIEYVYVEILNEWTDQGGDVYRLPYELDGNETRLDTVPGRAISTVSGVRYATDSSDYTTYRIAEGGNTTQPPANILESYFKTTDFFIEFKVSPGMAITDYSLFMIAGQYGIHKENATGTSRAENINVINSEFGLYDNGAGISDLYNCNEYFSLFLGYQGRGGGTSNLHSCKSYQPEASAIVKDYGGGYSCGVDASAIASTINCYGCHTDKAGDDGYQPIGAGILNMYGCTEKDSKGNAIELNCSHSGSMIIEGFTGTGVFRDQSLSATTVTMNGLVCSAIQLDQNHTRTYTVGTDCQCEASAAAYTGGALAVANIDNNVNYDYTVDYDTSTFVPDSSSVLVGTGSRWWTGANPVGSNGEPFSDFDTDAGGIQSTHGPFHPVNL